MNYTRIYNSIIEKAQFENRFKGNGIYYEKHHINPKCLDGSDSIFNLVLLTGKEHFICHKLLTYIHKGNRKIALAFHKMSFCKNTHYHISSKDYQYARELLSNIPMSVDTKTKISEGVSKALKGKPKTKKHKLKLKLANLGKTATLETRIKMSQKRKGKMKSLEHKNNIRNSHYGIKPSTKSKFRNSQSNKNSKKYTCEYCGKIANGGNYSRWHGEKCKLKNERFN